MGEEVDDALDRVEVGLTLGGIGDEGLCLAKIFMAAETSAQNVMRSSHKTYKTSCAFSLTESTILFLLG